MTALIVVTTVLACLAVAQSILIVGLYLLLRGESRRLGEVIDGCAEEFVAQDKYNHLVREALETHAKALKLKDDFFKTDESEETE